MACLVAAWLVSGRGNLHSFNAPLAAVGTVAFIYSILGTRTTIPQRILASKPFVFVGRISYEVYLWHPTVLIGSAIAVGSVQNQVFWWAYPIVFALATATHFGFGPLQSRWRQKLKARQATKN